MIATGAHGKSGDALDHVEGVTEEKLDLRRLESATAASVMMKIHRLKAATQIAARVSFRFSYIFSNYLLLVNSLLFHHLISK